jgi:hypothetical protein
MTVGALDRPVLVGDARVVAGRRHAVMSAQILIAARQIGFSIPIEIAEGRRQAVAAMLRGNPAERPECVLQPLRQCDKTLTAENDLGVLGRFSS